MKNPSFQFYPADWLNDIKLRMATYEEKGFLIDLMCLLHQSEEYGILTKEMEKNLHLLLNTHHNRVGKLLGKVVGKGICKRDSKTGCIYNSRMVNDERIRQIRKACGSKGGNPILVKQKVKQSSNQKPNQKATPSSSSSSSSSINTTSSLRSDVKCTPVGKMQDGDFLAFWAEYPRKVGKKKARTAFLRLGRSLLPEILDCLGRHKASKDWTKDDGEYIPHPTTWINGERWTDEVREDPRARKSGESWTTYQERLYKLDNQ